MIIIDEAAEARLIQAIRKLTNLEGMYCLHIPALLHDALHTRRLVSDVAREYLPESNLYFSDRGEIFIVMRNIAPKECRKAMLEIAHALDVMPAERVGRIYDLEVDASSLIAMLESKTEDRRRAAEEASKRQAKELTERKRKGMLELPNVARNAGAKRKGRREPQLMIIEDDPFSRRLVSNVLSKRYHLTELASADDALMTYARIAPDLLFLDINLPDVTGHELLEKIMTFDPEAYVVMLSGNADVANISQAMQRGAAGFVAKPFCRDKLLQYIERCPTISKENVQ